MHPVDHIKNRQKSKKFQPAAPAAPPSGGFTALPGGASPAAPPMPPKKRPMFMMGRGK